MTNLKQKVGYMLKNKMIVAIVAMATLVNSGVYAKTAKDSTEGSNVISVLVPQDTKVEVAPPQDVVVAARVLGGLIGLAMLEGGKDVVKKHFSVAIEDLEQFDFENYISDKLVKKIATQGKFQTQKESRPIVKEVLRIGFANSVKPENYMKRAPAYKRFKKKELVKIDNNLFLHYAFHVFVQGNKESAAGNMRLVLGFGDRNEKDALWTFIKEIKTQEHSPEQAKEITPALIKLLDQAIDEAVNDFYSNRNSKE